MQTDGLLRTRRQLLKRVHSSLFHFCYTTSFLDVEILARFFYIVEAKKRKKKEKERLCVCVSSVSSKIAVIFLALEVRG